MSSYYQGQQSDNNQVTIGTSATPIVPARTGRAAVKITNLGTTDVYLGDANVTTSTGDLLLGVKGNWVSIPGSAAIYGVVGSASQSVSYMEALA